MRIGLFDIYLRRIKNVAVLEGIDQPRASREQEWENSGDMILIPNQKIHRINR